MRDILKKDLYRYIGDGNKSILQQLRYILFTPGFQYTYCFRHVQLARNPISRMFWKVLLRRCMFHSGIQRPAETKIDAGFRISHFGTIVVNPGTIIGKNFNIAQGCLIGNANGRKKGVPKIVNNVCMGANSIVIGGITIADNVMIAPGAFVNFDVPANSIVIGNPGKIIAKPNPTDKYIVYKI